MVWMGTEASFLEGHMEDQFEQLQRFFNACDEIVKGSYLQAESRIAEVLRSIAACPALVKLFTAVTDGYDFPAAKNAYLRAPKGRLGVAALLPAERSEVLAYVFCLLVELDAGSIRFNDFLLRYFHTDGSYTGSYTVFADRVVRPFRDIVRDCFPDFSPSGKATLLRKKRDELLGALSERLQEERARIASLDLNETDAAGGDAILSAACEAANRRDARELTALLTGYRYFLRNVRAEGISTAAIFDLAAQL